MTNQIVIDNMMRQCVYDCSGPCPTWLLVVLGVLVVGFIGFLIWVIKETWI